MGSLELTQRLNKMHGKSFSFNQQVVAVKNHTINEKNEIILHLRDNKRLMVLEKSLDDFEPLGTNDQVITDDDNGAITINEAPNNPISSSYEGAKVNDVLSKLLDDLSDPNKEVDVTRVEAINGAVDSMVKNGRLMLDAHKLQYDYKKLELAEKESKYRIAGGSL